jgi:hypothetical protein
MTNEADGWRSPICVSPRSHVLEGSSSLRPACARPSPPPPGAAGWRRQRRGSACGRLGRLLDQLHEPRRVVREAARVAGVVELDRGRPGALGHEPLQGRVDDPVGGRDRVPRTRGVPGPGPGCSAEDDQARRVLVGCQLGGQLRFRSWAKSSRKYCGAMMTKGSPDANTSAVRRWVRPFMTLLLEE